MTTTVFLVFIACMGPHRCHQVGLGSFPSVDACVVESLPAVAEWMGLHPMYTSHREITCGPAPADEGEDL